MKIERLDHLVLTVADIEHSVRFYGQTLGMERINFAAGRVALAFGQQKYQVTSRGGRGVLTSKRTKFEEIVQPEIQLVDWSEMEED